MPKTDGNPSEGQVASTFSAPVVLSTEQEATLTAIQTALQLIDDTVYVDDADWTDSTSKHILIGGLYQSAPQTIADGDVGPLQVDANGRLLLSGAVTIGEIAGDIAHDAVDSGKPVKIGGKYIAVPVAVADGDRVDGLFDAYGRLRVLNDYSLDPANDSVLLAGNDGDDGAGVIRTIKTDSTGATFISGVSGNSYSHLTADGQVKGSAGYLHLVTINNVTANGTITIYDSLTESGTVIAAIALTTTSTFPMTLIYDVTCATGIYAGFDGTVTGDITVSYR